jgi:branched-chain amino acid transport system permease protein
MGRFLGIDSATIFRSGFRKFVFSVIIMMIVLFFSRGLMGDKELSFGRLAARLKRKPKPAVAGKGDDSIA